MSGEPEYYTADSLALAAGVSRRVFFKHLRCDVGQLAKAREVHPGLGIRYHAPGCRKYLSLVRAGQELKAARAGAQVQAEAECESKPEAGAPTAAAAAAVVTTEPSCK